MSYVETPRTLSISAIVAKKASLSPHNYHTILFNAPKHQRVKDFLFGAPIQGEEVGSNAYISKSTKFLVRNKALQPDSFLLEFIGDSLVPILPSRFANLGLKRGDLIISKDSNIGEVAILEQDYPNHMLSGGLFKLPVEKDKFYLFAILKHEFFKTQLDLLVSKGATIQHAKKLFLDCIIPLPHQNNADEIVAYVETLVRMVIAKEGLIHQKEAGVFDLIEHELSGGQADKEFSSRWPRLSEIKTAGRMDAGFYCEDYQTKQFLISNYRHGAGTVQEWGFDIGRGQNLQVTAIGTSVYTDKEKLHYYTLVRPVNLSDYGTVTRYEYLGNPKALSTINEGDIIFSAEGSVGKCVMFADPRQRLVTNIHGIVLNKKNHDKAESAFVCCFLRYLRMRGVLDYISVGGQGGSLAEKYWPNIRIPFFPSYERQAISRLYSHSTAYDNESPSLANLASVDDILNKQMGILQLDHHIKVLKNQINTVVDLLVRGESIPVDLSFLAKF